MIRLRSSVSRALIVLAASGVLGLTGAHAKVITVTLTGAQESISDNADIFGLGAGKITNQPFAETFKIDTAGGNIADSSNFVSYNSIFGGGPPYAVSGSLTINGHTLTTMGSDYSSVSSGSDYQILSSDVSPTGGSDSQFYLDLTGAGLPTSVSQTFSSSVGGTITAANNSFTDHASGGNTFDAIGTLDPTHFSVGAVSAAPEPSTWALMIAGLAGVGLTLRRAKRKMGFRFKDAFAA